MQSFFSANLNWSEFLSICKGIFGGKNLEEYIQMKFIALMCNCVKLKMWFKRKRWKKKDKYHAWSKTRFLWFTWIFHTLVHCAANSEKEKYTIYRSFRVDLVCLRTHIKLWVFEWFFNVCSVKGWQRWAKEHKEMIWARGKESFNIAYSIHRTK